MMLALPQVNLKIYPGTDVVLQLSLDNQMSETLLLHPTLDDWVTETGEVFSTVNHLDPAYVYLLPGCATKQRITLEIPLHLKAGTTLKSWLRFPGVLEEAIPLHLAILAPAPAQNPLKVLEYPLAVTFPQSQANQHPSLSPLDQTTAGIFGLISGIIDLDQRPSRGLVAELGVILFQVGDHYAQTSSGRELLNGLKSNPFFQNGVQAFATAQVPTWIAHSLTRSSPSVPSLLYSWEQWLLGLAQTDLEATPINPNVLTPPLWIDSRFSPGEMSAEEWFTGIVLGLAQLSPRIATRLRAIATQKTHGSPLNTTAAAAASYSLAAGLPGLDQLPVRWLVVELLILLAQRGDDYAQTEPGHQLLDRLSRTRFVKNGILAFAAAQATRWLVMSEAAAVAYQTSASSLFGQGRLLDVGEQWLWSLVPTHLPGVLDAIPSVSGSSRQGFIDRMGLDAQRWFISLIVGLTLLSPRLAAIVNAIATQVPPSPPPPAASPTPFEDVIGDHQPILR